MFKETRDPPPDVGEVRKRQVWIGDKDHSIDDARFVPAPGDDRLRAGLDAWVNWIESENVLAPVLRVAMAHYQFETLHPFGDGNGRIGRLAIILQLMRYGIVQEPAVTLSPWFLRNRSAYQDQLLNLSVSGDWNPWVRFFCAAISDQCVALINGAEALAQWLSSARELVVKKRWGGAIHDVVNNLTEWPVLTIATAATKYDLTPVAATRIINHLCEVDILRELTGGTYARVYGAQGVMDIVEHI
jgi:Fic family protein